MNQEVKIQQEFRVSDKELWKAITDKEVMKNWYFDLEEFKPEVGFEFEFWGESETRKYLHFCKITEVKKGKRICYTWKYDQIPGSTLVCFEINPLPKNRSELILRHSGFETFPPEMNELKAENFEIGWTQIIKTSLKNFLEKKN